MPSHVTLAKPFRLDVYELTEGELKAVMRCEPWKGKERTKEGDEIATSFIGRERAIKFCRRLSDLERTDQENWLSTEA